MVKIYVVLLALIALCGCRDSSEQSEVADSGSQNLHGLKLPEKLSLNSAARQFAVEWPEFLSLESSLEGFQRVENLEDLRLLVDEIIENEKRLSASNYPERFDKPQVRSRQKVFKTQLLKVKAQLEYRTDPRLALAETMEAYNALCTQLNVIVNNNLDTKLISDD